jgi:hypothetical protein
VLRDASHSAPEDVRPSPDVPGGAASRHDDEHAHGHEHHSLVAPHEHHAHGDQVHCDHVPVEAVAPTTPSRAVVINVGEHLGALVLASNEERSGTEVEIHPVSRPDARTHVWVLPREGRDGIVYAAIFPSLESGDYAILNVDGSIADVVSVPPTRVTYARWA